MRRVVLDTNVLVAGLRSRRGASFQLLEKLGGDAPAFQPCLSVPLVLEYESALRKVEGIEKADTEALVDYLCSIGDLREIYFLWRPFLRDPADEMVLEVGVEANAEAIVTHNLRDFAGVREQFGIRVITPGTFLRELREEER